MPSENAVRLVRHGRVGVIMINQPPVNSIGQAVRQGLVECIAELENDSSLQAGVIACEGKTFCSGADMSEFDTGIAEPGYRKTLGVIENCSKPIVAAIHGMALGGGVELAMACHYRIALTTARLGMPEISLGLLPGAGATQRLPRLVGAVNALDMMLSGKPQTADQALKIGLIDSVTDKDIVAEGVSFAETLLADQRGINPTSNRAVDATGFDQGLDQLMAGYARFLKGRTTQNYFVQALQAAISESFEKGLDIEHELAMSALASSESNALRHAFFAERATSKIPGLASEIKPLSIKNVAVIGAGTMGSGIAMAFANAGFKVVIVDSKEDGLNRGKQLVRTVYEGSAKRKGLDQTQVEAQIANISFSLSFDSIKDTDLIVEAVFEDMDIKKQVLAQIDKVAPLHAIIASNTSSLSIDELASVTGRPEKVIGLHFFSPAHVMRLLEIVRGKKTSAETILTGMDVARQIKKIGVVSGDAFGFIGNRMMLDGYFREAEQLLLEGASPEQVDRVMEDFGFAMGPSRVNDMGGVDIGTSVRQQLFQRESRQDPYCVVSDKLTELGWLGQKTGRGYYNYADDPRKGVVDPQVTEIISQLAADRNIVQRKISDEEIEERCILQLINVGAQVLAEGVAYRSGDIDVVWLAGYGFPRHLGGPMCYADSLGLKHVADRIRHYYKLHGQYWLPSPLLEELANSGLSFSTFTPA
ncbi:MAG: 3-hydroxyacyl-CoA dehydrogenase NAD-binding domain-containing protein [Spongiibacteraceae bacterium]